MSASDQVPVVVITGAHPRLYNHDLAPVAPAGAHLGARSACSRCGCRMSTRWAATPSRRACSSSAWPVGRCWCRWPIGIGIVYVLMNLVGRPSQKYGVPFPVFARMAFGVMGANLAAIVRGVVGIVWLRGADLFRVQGGRGVGDRAGSPQRRRTPTTTCSGCRRLGWGSFLFMWFFQLVIFLSGMESIRKFIDFCGPIVYLVMFVLAGWMISRTGLDSFSMQLSDKQYSGLESIGLMANAAMLIVAYFAALLLNFGDFSRFAKSEAAMKSGNFWGLPVNFILFAIITVIVTGGSMKVFGQAIMDPVLIVEKINNPIATIVGSITFIVATMGINIVANFRLAGLRHRQPRAAEDQLQDGRPDHLDPVGPGLSRGSSSPARTRSRSSSASSARCWGRCSASWWPTTTS